MTNIKNKMEIKEVRIFTVVLPQWLFLVNNIMESYTVTTIDISGEYFFLLSCCIFDKNFIPIHKNWQKIPVFVKLFNL